MATTYEHEYGSIVGGYGRLYFYIEQTNSSTSTTVDVDVCFWSKYSVSDTNNELFFNDLASSGSATTSLGSKTIKTTNNSGSGWDASNAITLYTYSKTYTRTTSAQTRYLYAKLTGIDRVGGTMTVGTTVTIPKLDSYTVGYNANGGSGAPSSQTKWYGQTLTLSSTKPTRTGYSFQGWALTKADADNSTWYYQPGGTCGRNENLTLYAVWRANTYTVAFNANGGSGAPADQTKTYGVSLTLSSTKPTRTNYNFKGWGTSASATTVAYAAGGSYTANAGATLYAIWELAYAKPRITNFVFSRCPSEQDASVDDQGTYAWVYFEWVCDRSVTTVKIEWKPSSTTTWANAKSISSSGTSGVVSTIIGSGGLSVDNTYDIRATVADGSGDAYTSTETGILEGTHFVIDLKSGGDGIAFGKPAEDSGYMDVGFTAKFRDQIYASDHVNLATNNKYLWGLTTDGKWCQLIGINGSNNALVGYGGYSNSIGATNLYGNVVNVQSKGNVNVKSPLHLDVTTDASGTANNNPALTIGPTSGTHLELDGNEIMSKASGTTTGSLYINSDGGNVCLNDNNIGSTFVRGCRIAENKVLWSGGWYMSADHTANLEENISDQANGVVLVWSFYENGAAQDYAWNMVFVPKYLMSVAGGTGMSMFLTTATGNSVATKYLYVYNSKIVGYTNSSDSNIGNAGGSRTTTSGITLTPRAFVLRYVIGV